MKTILSTLKCYLFYRLPFIPRPPRDGQQPAGKDQQ